MNKVNFLEAIGIISNHHSTILTINQPKDNFVGSTFKIHITDCVPAVIYDLKDAGFMLNMENGQLAVTDTLKK